MAIRSAISKWYCERYNCGDERYRYKKSEGEWIGNPSLSQPVSRYMRSLRKRKAQQGQGSEQVRALVPDDIKRLHELWTKSRGTSMEAVRARQHVSMYILPV